MSNTLEDHAYKTATELAQKAAEKLFEKVLTANGIPAPLGIVHTKLITEYSKRFSELFLAVRKYDGFWVKLRTGSKYLNEHLILMEQKIKGTPLPSLPELGPMALFGPLIDTRAAFAITKERRDFLSAAKTVTEGLDALVQGNEEVIDQLLEAIDEIDKFLKLDRPNNLFERSYGQGSMMTERADWCWYGEQLLRTTDRLLAHRNQWAKLSKMGPSYSKFRPSLEKRCFVR